MVPKRSEQVAKIEPEGAKLLEAYPQMAQRFRDAGWFEFLTAFQGYDEWVSMEFSLNFDGHEVEIDKMLMLVTEHTIAKACKLVVGGEIWWKKEHVVTEFVNQFLLPEKQNPDWRNSLQLGPTRMTHCPGGDSQIHHLRREVFFDLHLSYQNIDASKR
jgi:hypothetical protein